MTIKKVKTTCPYCGVGCGVLAEVAATASLSDQSNQPLSHPSTPFTVTGVAGDAEHPANLGRLCVKGSSLHETLGDHGRLLKPVVEGVEQDWDTALDHVAGQLSQIIAQHGPESVAFYLSGQLLTEDYYVANKLAKGFIKTPHVDTNSRLCMSSAVAAYKQTLGADAVPCDYTDLEHANLLILVGSNAAWAHPILYQRMVAAKQANPDLKVVVIDPRATATTDLADLHLAIAPDSDIWLFNGLMKFLQQHNYVDHNFVEQATSGLTEALAAVQNCSIEQVISHTGINEQDLLQFYQWFADTEKTVSFYSQGVNQSTVGTDKNCSIINCHLLTGRIGKVGMGPFSITGQPNAMGGREVGGLANMLAAHMNYSDAEKDRVARFWQVDQVCDGPGYKAVDLFEAMDQGKIKAVWIMATNPVVSMPEADKVARALGKCDLVIVSDCYRQTDTGQLANVLLPATGWGEKDGTVTNSERRISRQRPLLPATGEARHDWLIMSQVAQRMGFAQGFNYQTPHQVFIEHAQLSDFENNGQRAFDIGALAAINAQDYEDLTPIQWPLPKSADGINKQATRLFADRKFFTNHQKAQFKTIKLVDVTTSNEASPGHKVYTLNSGRSRDQWHTMTRTGRTKRLLEHQDTPYLSVNGADAKQADIQTGDLIQVSAAGSDHTSGFDQSVIATAKIETGIGRQQCFMPIHWTDQFASNSRVSKVIGPQTDDQSGQPGFKQAQVTLAKLPYEYTAYWLIRDEDSLFSRPAQRQSMLNHCLYWSRVPFNGAGLYRLYFASAKALDEFVQQQSSMSKAQLSDSKVCHYQNGINGDQRYLGYQAGQICFGIFASRYHPSPDVSGLPEKSWMMQLLAEEFEGSPWPLLAGRSVDQVDLGPVICACFGIHKNPITDAIESGCESAEQLGQQLKCGTNCGSCIPELKQLILDHQPQ